MRCTSRMRNVIHGDASAIDGIPGDYRHYYAALCDAIRDGGPAPVTAAQALEVMRVLEAGHASARNQRAIAFD